MERVNCNLCGSNDKSLWKSIDSWRIVRCGRCGFAFLDPRPTPEELDKLLTAERIGGMYDGALERKDGSAGAMGDRLAMLARSKTGGAILDVGCGEGSFLAAVREMGWSVMGVELLETAGSVARQRLGGGVLIGDVLGVELPAHRFDAITLWDSLEHMRDPMAVVRGLKARLKPDGILIVRVPNCASFDSFVCGRKWMHWSLPLHMSHFTPRTLCRLLEINGLRVEAVETRISSLVWSLRNALRWRTRKADADTSAPTRPAIAAAPRERRSVRMLKKLFTGREVTAVARPR